MKEFKDLVVYQAYPKSWQDTTGNGKGDLRGVTQRLPYLADLGIDLLWLNPFYKSPQRDNGYDISDYKSIDPDYGTWEDLDELVQKAGDLGIGLMFDMVLNHVSTDHDWFQKAVAGDPYYQDFFYIRPAKEDGSLPTNWESKFGGPAWAPFPGSDDYYLCLYDKSQADLNWHNPNVRQALYDVVNFWIDKGVKGFRFDVLNVIGKDLDLKDAEDGVGKKEYTDTPIVHEWIRELNQQSFGRRGDLVTVGEMSSTTIEDSIKYSNPKYQELDMVFSFHHLKVDYKNGDKWTQMDFDFKELKRVLNDWQVGLTQGGGWNALFWNNHDQPRANSRFGDPKNYPYETATMLATTIHLLRGTPYIYQGEEIGMTNPNFDSIDDYQDVESHNAYQSLVEKGQGPDQALGIIQDKSRDNGRTPMQWTGGDQAGFTTGQPWINLAPNYKEVNTQVPDPSQKIFTYYQKLIRLRKDYKVISQGDYQGVQLDHDRIFAYLRVYQGQKLLVLNHFYPGQANIGLDPDLVDQSAKVLISNSGDRTLQEDFTMGPYESVAFLID
ncbi:alpha,alpha-phosphotrehalase [Alloiococcus otitis]|uniref:alpha,alpha-phosphotrehalase n=1 Tax=Alloiococcus otitis TaxID=1652 RepID=UPI002356919E|nr:alpha,alpha-phosphotrehalase [Alloiococcus otitis]